MDTPLLPDDFKEFLKLLNAKKVEYLLIGGNNLLQEFPCNRAFLPCH